MLFTLLVMVASGSVQAQTAQPERLSYDEFIQKVQDGKVKSVSLGSLYYVEGTYLEENTEKEFFCQRPLEPVSDPLLTELLEKHEVSVVRKDPPEPSSMDRLAQYLPILILLVPPVLMVIVLVYIVRINNKINQVVIR